MLNLIEIIMIRFSIIEIENELKSLDVRTHLKIRLTDSIN